MKLPSVYYVCGDCMARWAPPKGLRCPKCEGHKLFINCDESLYGYRAVENVSQDDEEVEKVKLD